MERLPILLPRLTGRRASFKIGVVATLAIAVAANVAVLGNLGVLFGPVVPGASHRDLYEPHLDALEATADTSQIGIFRPVYDRLSTSLKGRAETALYQLRGGTLGKGANEKRFFFLFVTPSLSHVLGTHVVAGRALDAADTKPGATPVMVLSDRVARAQFGSAQAAIGKTLALNDKRYRVVGVHSSALEFPSGPLVPNVRTGAWLPFQPETAGPPKSVYRSMFMFAVVRPGPNLSVAAVKAALGRAYRLALADYPTYWQARMKQMHFVPRVTPLVQREYGSVIKRLLLLELAALLLLVLVFANLAGLATSDAITRRHELATRAALGGSVARLFAGRVRELVLLGLLAWAVGVGLGWLGHRALAAAIGQAGASAVLSPPLLGLSLLVVFVIATMLALPGMQRIRKPHNLMVDLASGGHSTGGQGLTRTLRVFIALQLATSMVLLVVAGNLYYNGFAVTLHNLGIEKKHRPFFSLPFSGPGG